MNINDFDFSLPKKNIAQEPKKSRSSSKLLVINRTTNKLKNENFSNIEKYITNNDLIVVNDTKVIPARLYGLRKYTKGKVEILIERIINDESFICQIKSTRKIKKDDIIIINNDINLIIIKDIETLVEIKVLNYSVKNLLLNYGSIPLPPYIQRSPSEEDNI